MQEDKELNELQNVKKKSSTTKHANVNMLDKMEKHNKAIKKTGKTNQQITNDDKFIIAMLSVIIFIFAFASLFVIFQCSSDGDAFGVRIGIAILVLLIPFVCFLFVKIRKYIAIKKNKEYKSLPCSNHLIFISIFGCLWLFYKLLNYANQPVLIFDIGVPVVLVIIVFDYIKSLIIYYRNRKIINGQVYSVRCKGKYISCKFSSSSSTSVNNVPTSLYVKYKIKFSYIDDTGEKHTFVSNEEYTHDEVSYLKYKKEFDIMISKKSAIIVEDLTNTEIVNNEENDFETKSSSSEKESHGNYPLFANEKVYKISTILAMATCLIMMIAGVLMVAIGGNLAGVFFIVVGAFAIIGVLIFYLPLLLVEKRGKSYLAILKEIEVQRLNKSKNFYAIIELGGELKKIPFLHQEWYPILNNYVGKSIPVKVYNNTTIIDFKKLYTDKM